MRELQIEISGDKLDLLKITKIFQSFEIKKRFAESIYFYEKNFTFESNVNFIKENFEELKKHGANNIIFWEILDYESQNNGEISPDLINLLSCINAGYCWTVI